MRLCIILLLFSFQFLSAETVIVGKILGYQGTALESSGVSYYKHDNPNQTNYVKSEGAGDFKLILKDEGIYTLKLTGAFHKEFTIELPVLEQKKEFEIVIGLEPYQWKEYITKLQVVGNFNNYDFYEGVIDMTFDGEVYKAYVPVINDTLNYQIYGLAPNTLDRSINGTMYDELKFDGDGDYESVIYSENEMVELILDPDKFPKTEHGFKIYNISPELISLIMLNDKLKKLSNDWRQEYVEAVLNKDEQKADSINIANLKYSEQLVYDQFHYLPKITAMMVYIQNIDGIIEKDNRAELINKDLVELIYKTVPAKTFLWDKYGYSIYTTTALISDSPLESSFLKKLLDQGDDELNIKILYDGLRYTHNTGDTYNAKKIYELMNNKYAENRFTKKAFKEYSPYKQIRIGNKLPEFSYVEVGDSTKTITNKDIEGKYTLIDIWATWCGPCIMEMPGLHKLYERYKDQGFEILSISIDPQRSLPARFRNGSFPMPWLSVWSEGEYESGAGELFEVTNLPKPILVDPEGKIIAIDDGLHGDELNETLDSLLK